MFQKQTNKSKRSWETEFKWPAQIVLSLGAKKQDVQSGMSFHLLSAHPCLGWPFRRMQFGNHCAVRAETAAGVSLHPLAAPAMPCTAGAQSLSPAGMWF